MSEFMICLVCKGNKHRSMFNKLVSGGYSNICRLCTEVKPVGINPQLIRVYLKPNSYISKAKKYGGAWEEYDPVEVIETEENIPVCQICHLPVSLEEMTLDHIVPLIMGGPDALFNVRLAHKRCHKSRPKYGEDISPVLIASIFLQARSIIPPITII